MMRSAIYTTVFEGLLLKEVSPSFYEVVGTPLVIRLLSIGGWQVVYRDHEKWVACFNEPHASLELAARDTFYMLEITCSAAMKLPVPPMKLPVPSHPTPEVIGDVVVIRPSAQDGVQSLVKPMERPATLLPAVMDKERMIGWVAARVATVRHRLEKEYSREWLATALRNGLREGRQPLTDYAVYAADRGDEITDGELRHVAREMMNGILTERGPGHLQIWAYGDRALERAPHKRPPGHRWHDNWMRDILICALIELACREFRLRPTRNRAAQQSAEGAPSGISIIVAALALNNIHLSEATVQEHIWRSWLGEIVCGARGAPLVVCS